MGVGEWRGKSETDGKEWQAVIRNECGAKGGAWRDTSTQTQATSSRLVLGHPTVSPWDNVTLRVPAWLPRLPEEAQVQDGT